ncbi:hypothetical protein Tco_1149408, partial [Tanacetum coccineum]
GRRINVIDADEDITLVNVQDDADNEMFDVDALNDEEVFGAGQNENVVEKVVDAAQVSIAATTVTITTEGITLAQALKVLKTSKPKVKGIVFQELSTTTTKISLQQSQDKAEFDEEEKLAREKAEKEKEANISLIEEWDDIQAKIDLDHQLAKILQAQEQEELSDAEKATLFQQLLEKRRKHFAAKRAKEKRNKPPTQAQQKKSCKMFDRAFKMKVDEDKDTAELQSLIEVILDEEEVEIDVVPLAIKSPMEDLDLLLWGDWKTMFEPHVEDTIWRNQQDYKVLEWKSYDSCGVHSLRMQHVYIYMLVEKRYPLTPSTITDMLNKKLQVDYFSEMAYQLLKLFTK